MVCMHGSASICSKIYSMHTSRCVSTHTPINMPTHMSLQTPVHMSWLVPILIPMRISLRMSIAIEHQVVMSESVAIRSILPVRSENTTAVRIP